MKWKASILAAACVALSGSALSAATINGTFDLGGNITATASTISWSLTEPGGTVVANKALISGATGDYAGLNGTTVTIENLDSTTEPTGSMFADTLFISFDAAPTLAPLDINFIFAGVFGIADCTAAPAPGQTCTPNGLASSGQSPFSFLNNPPASHITSSATFAFAGTEDTS
ncbi:MAG TPA: hypothetical protein VHW24_25630, partial [Bryobacteraceae bacterium]|nr:hypothetical protein [Bryobacteraceae bacterium]